MIEGDDGIIIIDTTESPTSAQAILKEFRHITSKPVVGIIYTHFHHDHVGGTKTFLNEAKEDRSCPIWAHVTTNARMKEFGLTGPIAYTRATKMFGTRLEHPSLENCGIGPFLCGVDGDDLGLEISPTHTYESHRMIEIAGVKLELIHAPGETDDQTVVYLPKHKILFAADNYYESFPNLYTIRGAPHRDVVQWASSIDTMINVDAEIMVPSHTLPVHGAAEVRERLQNYRDAIQYVHDQTVRLMLKDHHPDEIAAMVQLPSNLRKCEYLKQFYGTVGWSAKAIFNGYLGWFSGDECDLWKLPPKEYATRMIDLAGSAENVLDKAQAAYDKGDVQWALELSTAILRASEMSTRKVTRAARDLKTKCCVQLGQQQISANGRNWYMTSALLNDGEIDKIRIPEKHKKNAILTFPLNDIFKMLSVNFAPQESLVGVNKTMCFSLKGNSNNAVQEAAGEDGYTLTIRNCVLYSKNEVNADADIVIETTEQALRQLLSQPSSIAASVLSNELSVKKGDIKTFYQFLSSIDRME